VSRLESGTVVGFKAGEEGIEHFPPRDDDNVEPFDRLVPPEHFAGQALGAVPNCRRAQFSRGRHTEPGCGATIRYHEHRHVPRLDSGTGRVRALEIGAAPYVLGRRELLPDHHVASIA
jgi:hypothetical protein